jgi:MFS family permease
MVLYPRGFRQRYSAPMVQLFGDRLRDEGARAWVLTLADLVRSVPKERVEAAMTALSPAAKVVVIALVVLGAALGAMGLGGGVTPLIALAVVVLLVTQRRLFASLPLGERARLRHAVIQTWWAPVAGLLGAAMVLAGIGTVFEAHNWGGRIIGSSLLMAFGVAMLFGLMRRPFARQAGNSLILLATVPPLLFFWIIVPPVAAIVVWIGVLSSGFGDDRVAPAVP